MIVHSLCLSLSPQAGPETEMDSQHRWAQELNVGNLIPEECTSNVPSFLNSIMKNVTSFHRILVSYFVRPQIHTSYKKTGQEKETREKCFRVPLENRRPFLLSLIFHVYSAIKNLGI